MTLQPVSLSPQHLKTLPRMGDATDPEVRKWRAPAWSRTHHLIGKSAYAIPNRHFLSLPPSLLFPVPLQQWSHFCSWWEGTPSTTTLVIQKFLLLPESITHKMDWKYLTTANNSTCGELMTQCSLDKKVRYYWVYFIHSNLNFCPFLRACPKFKLLLTNWSACPPFQRTLFFQEAIPPPCLRWLSLQCCCHCCCHHHWPHCHQQPRPPQGWCPSIPSMNTEWHCWTLLSNLIVWSLWSCPPCPCHIWFLQVDVHTLAVHGLEELFFPCLRLILLWVSLSMVTIQWGSW